MGWGMEVELLEELQSTVRATLSRDKATNKERSLREMREEEEEVRVQ
jgi:hypothetical protein